MQEALINLLVINDESDKFLFLEIVSFEVKLIS